MDKLNLEVYLHWSKWSDCNDGKQTRIGHCYLRKMNPNKRFDKLVDGNYNVMKWLHTVHSLLENVQEFRNEGVMVFR